MGKIILRSRGGLGNQLFSFAAARRLAIASNSELIIDDISGFARDFTYNRSYQLDHFHIPCRKATALERLEPFPALGRLLLRFVSRFQSFERQQYIRQEGVDFDERLLNVKPHGVVYLEGYWQSANYFIDVVSTICRELEIRPPTDPINLTIAKRMNCCTAVAVHVRFFDQPLEIGINNASVDYYTRAVDAMERLVPGAHYFIFSDDPDAARGRIPLPDNRVTLVAHNRGDERAYADLWLMTQCQHFIIANSTFSWWGAWLAKSVDKQVIAPGFEKRDGVMSWGFKGLLPGAWIKI